MATVTIRNLPEDVHRALRIRAAQNNRSTEAEVRTILEAAVKPKLRTGSELIEIGRSIMLTDEEAEHFESLRVKAQTTPIQFHE